MKGLQVYFSSEFIFRFLLHNKYRGKKHISKLCVKIWVICLKQYYLSVLSNIWET